MGSSVLALIRVKLITAWPEAGGGLTVTVTSSLEESVPSLAVRRRTYVPAVVNEAVVSIAEALAKLTLPGPLVRVQALVRVPGTGKPSSVTVPLRLAGPGKVMV
jgi:hypothetical protein